MDNFLGKGKSIAGVTSQFYHRSFTIAIISSQFYHRSQILTTIGYVILLLILHAHDLVSFGTWIKNEKQIYRHKKYNFSIQTLHAFWILSILTCISDWFQLILQHLFKLNQFFTYIFSIRLYFKLKVDACIVQNVLFYNSLYYSLKFKYEIDNLILSQIF